MGEGVRLPKGGEEMFIFATTGSHILWVKRAISTEMKRPEVEAGVQLRHNDEVRYLRDAA
jgi:hypothetical protein